ncbi:alanine/ornithine racemase family PLP-dependent enzyme [Aminobacterium colombiense]|uniref:alanine/ornithine racemase family PLP-dependent enzyme n=1 Tax=Aminobacterium colombiense TaxID=81468 RepID=UPI003334576E
MGIYPRLTVFCDKIAYNASQIVSLCRQWNIGVYGVAKGACAQEDIVHVMVESGCEGIADSRIKNLYRLKKEMRLSVPIMMLRPPMMSEIPEVVEYGDSSVVSMSETIRALDHESVFQKKDHLVLLMIDLGDLREGIWPDELEQIGKILKGCQRVRCMGVGVNFGCFGGVRPSMEKLEELGVLEKELESLLGYPLKVCSGGSTSSLALIEDGTMPSNVNALRIGEAILLGTDSSGGRPLPFLKQQTVILETEIIEVKRKPSFPLGEIAADAFGNIPSFVDRGVRLRAISAIGKQDARIEGLSPLEEGIEILGASSDHMVLDAEKYGRTLHVGDKVHFSVKYSALLALTTSPYVSIHVIK